MAAANDRALAEDHRYALVSSDSHCGAPLHDYKEYLESHWHDDFDAWAASYVDPWAELEGDDRNVGAASGTNEANWDSDLRQKQIESQGVVGEVLFPNTTPPFFPAGGIITVSNPETREDYERRRAGVMAHNRWLVDFCNALPGRRVGMGQVFLNDIDQAVDDVKRLREAGLGGIAIHGSPEGGPLPQFSSPYYEAFWSVCEDLSMPVHIHVGGSTLPPAYTQGHAERTPGNGALVLFEFGFWNHRAIPQLIVSGVFERHPDLRFVMTEGAAAWAPADIARLDAIIEGARIPGTINRRLCEGIEDVITKLPSEYFRRNVYLGASAGFSPRDAAARVELGLDCIMWGNDFPHNEGSYPYTVESLRVALEGVPPVEVEALVGGNALKVYDFDPVNVREAADRVGPTVAEIATPLPPEEDPRGGAHASATMMEKAAQRSPVQS